MTTKLNQLSQDLKIIDQTFTWWQHLNKFAADTKCHDSILLEFLSKHSTAVNRAFAALLQLTEMQDVLHQFSTLETKTLFGFPDLPPFLHPQILARLATYTTMGYTSKALNEGFPLFLNPMVVIEHRGNHIEASVLLTIPEVPDLNSFCTIENLTPIKFKSSGVCYTGPVTKLDLVMITCPNSKQIVSSAALNKCYQDSSAFTCPTNVLTVATYISWLGFPFNPDTKLTFLQHHAAAKDCSNLHPLIHLGGRTFCRHYGYNLSVVLWIANNCSAVYHIPCNVSFVCMVTGVGRCPQHLSVPIPLWTATSMLFFPWTAVVHNMSQPNFAHTKLVIPLPGTFNKLVLADLDSLSTHSTVSLSPVYQLLMTKLMPLPPQWLWGLQSTWPASPWPLVS